jgi:polynucleotide 5'-kinase involved in rRNA processing
MRSAAMAEPLHLPKDWADAIARLCGGGARRIAVLGPADVGKSAFLLTIAGAWLRDERLALLDLDPGQKLLGPVGTVSSGYLGGGEPACTRFRFVGSTSALPMRALIAGAADLARHEPLAANTSGFVHGPGARLQAASVAALRADWVVAISLPAPPLPAGWNGTLISLDPSPYAQRKSEGLRRRIRQEAFERHLGAESIIFSRLPFAPGPPLPFDSDRRPLCCLSDAAGEDMAVGVLEEVGGEELRVRCVAPPRPPALLRLGRMWARREGDGWKLLDKLEPAWAG